jgi:hypothetical protein
VGGVGLDHHHLGLGEGPGEHRPQGLGGEPLPPGPRGQPVADRHRPGRVRRPVEADIPHHHGVAGPDQLVDPVRARVGPVVDRPHERLDRDQRPLHRVPGHPGPRRVGLALEQGPRLVRLQLAQAQPFTLDPVPHPPSRDCLGSAGSQGQPQSWSAP